MKPVKAFLKTCSTKGLCAFLIAASIAAGNSPVDAAPHAGLALEQARIAVNAPFTITVTVEWQGAADEYSIVPPEPDYPEGIRQVSSSFSATASDTAHRLTYRFVLTADRKGAFTIPPVRITYWSRNSDKESSLVTQQALCEVVPFVFWSPAFRLAAVGCAAVLVALVITAAVIRRRRLLKKNKALHGSAAESAQGVREKLEECRRCKINGDYQGFYTWALETAKNLGGQDAGFGQHLASALEKVRFGGHRPPTDDIDRVMRTLEKMVAEAVSDKHQRDKEYETYLR